MTTDPELDALRARIDAIDDAIVDLVGERAKLVRSAAAIKAAHGVPLLDPARERAILARAEAKSAIPPEAIRAAIEGVLAACKKAL